MKLVYSELEKQIVLEENRVNVLVIENKQLFRSLIRNLNMQINGEEGLFTLSNDGKILKVEKEMNIILDPFNMEINSRKVLTGLYNELSKLAMSEDNYLKACALKSNVANYMYDLLNQVDYALEFQEDFSLQGLFKAMELQFETEEASFLDKIVHFMDVCSKFQKVKILAFVNLKAYLTANELRELYKEAFYRKMYLLLLESSIEDEVAEEEITIVDEDLCLIR